MKEYNIVTLCGSTKFKNEFLQAQKELTLAGNIVISVGLFGHSGDSEVWSDGTKAMLDDMHKKKIDMSNEIFVINPGGYIGESTKSEILYAKKTGKKITYMYHCGMCKNFLGCGDWNLCCSKPHPEAPLGFLCYENSPICKENFEKNEKADLS